MIRTASALVLAAVLGTAASAAAGISIGTPSVDPEPAVKVVAGVPVKLLATGSFKPPDPDGSPWITFVWNFGDGTPTVSKRYDGAGAHTDVVTHTFPQGGLYKVTVTGGHGFDFFGFRFVKTKTIKVRVECAGSAPGPKKCAKGTFNPFVGVWAAELLSELSGAILQLDQLDDVVFGALEYQGRDGIEVLLPIKGKPKFKAVELPFGGKVDALVVKFKAAHSVETPNGETKGRLIMPLRGDEPATYRELIVELEGAPALAPTPGPSNAGGVMTLAVRGDDMQARLCSTVGAGKRKAKPGDLVVFAVDVQNEGVGSLGARQVALDVDVEGGTIEDFALERAVVNASAPKALLTDLDALGAGKGQKHARAQALVAVRVAEGAREVVLDALPFHNLQVDDDPFTSIVDGERRRVCVPVVE